MEKKVKVLVVDDSSLMRKLLSDIFNSDPEFEVVGIAQTGPIALRKISELDPDLVTLDIMMPGMDGIQTLKRIMSESPRAVMMISSVAKKDAELTIKALNFGAADFFTKPQNILSKEFIKHKTELLEIAKTAANMKIDRIDLKDKEEEEEQVEKTIKELKTRPQSVQKGIISDARFDKIVAIGISTGGPQALKSVLPLFEENIDFPILIVQHMPENFTGAFAERMNALSKINVLEAEDSLQIIPGRAIIARGDNHLEIQKMKDRYFVRNTKAARVSMFRPSVDVLYKNVNHYFKEKTTGVIMTGMGYDGVEGMKNLHESGAATIAQDKKTSVVFGMNGIAVKNGYVDFVVPLNKITETILKLT